MSQNRNKIIGLFVGNIANSVLHKILEESVEEDIIKDHYDKEFSASLELAKKYRRRIDPVEAPLPEKDIASIKEKARRNVLAELKKRISKGYTNINLELVESTIERLLKDTKVIGK